VLAAMVSAVEQRMVAMGDAGYAVSGLCF